MTSFSQIFRNEGIWAGNKNVISADLENVGQSHYLQKSLYLCYYMTDLTKLLPK